ncbi:MAG: DUF302 domain-containing protein [Candidatus Hodarchaeota archaeon]
MVEILRKAIDMPFDDVVKLIEKIMTEEGFSVLLTKDIDEVLKTKLGITEYPRYTTILGCGPELAKMALDVSKDVGLLFPCSFVVYEEEEKVTVAHVSIMKIAVEINLASADAMAPVIAMTGEKVQAVWQKIFSN